MACSFSASLDPSRRVGRLSSQARYSSCRAINVAIAPPHVAAVDAGLAVFGLHALGCRFERGGDDRSEASDDRLR
jgi:hypothetical protein